MNLRDQLARVIARDSRYSIEWYAFVLESLKRARTHKLQERGNGGTGTARHDHASATSPRPAPGKPRPSNRAMSPAAKLCQAARRLALRYYGLMAITVLNAVGHPLHIRHRRDRLQSDRLGRPGQDPQRQTVGLR